MCVLGLVSNWRFLGVPGDGGTWRTQTVCRVSGPGSSASLSTLGSMSLWWGSHAWPPYVSALGGLGSRTSTISMRLQKQTSSSMVRWPSRCSTR